MSLVSTIFSVEKQRLLIISWDYESTEITYSTFSNIKETIQICKNKELWLMLRGQSIKHIIILSDKNTELKI